MVGEKKREREAKKNRKPTKKPLLILLKEKNKASEYFSPLSFVVIVHANSRISILGCLLMEFKLNTRSKLRNSTHIYMNEMKKKPEYCNAKENFRANFMRGGILLI